MSCASRDDVYISLLRDSLMLPRLPLRTLTSLQAALGLPLLANGLLLAYASCGDTEADRKVFDKMLVKNGIT